MASALATAFPLRESRFRSRAASWHNACSGGSLAEASQALMNHRIVSIGLVASSLTLPQLAAAQSPTALPPPPAPAAQLATALPAQSGPYSLRERNVVVTSPAGERLIPLGCPPHNLLLSNNRLYVSCGNGVLEFDASDPANPRPAVQRNAGRATSDLFVQNGRAWVMLGDEARPVESLPPVVDAPPPPPQMQMQPTMTPQGFVGWAQPAAPAEQPPVNGEVTASRLGEVTLSVGQSDGLSVGDRVELYHERRSGLERNERATGIDSLAVARVTAVSAHRARAQLGSNERAPVGSRARRTTLAATQSNMSPPRASGLWSFEATLRPFLSLNSIAVGSVSDVELVYRASFPLALRLDITPAAFALGSNSMFNFGMMALVSFDSHLFEVGIGGGAASNRNSGLNGTGAAIAQYVRLGARDGLHLEVRNTFVTGPDKFQHGSTVVTGVIPVSEASAFVLRGGGGGIGYAFGEVGLRVRVRGNGDAGSVFLTPSLGYADVFQAVCVATGYRDIPCINETVHQSGPMVGFGVEYRW